MYSSSSRYQQSPCPSLRTSATPSSNPPCSSTRSSSITSTCYTPHSNSHATGSYSCSTSLNLSTPSRNAEPQGLTRGSFQQWLRDSCSTGTDGFGLRDSTTSSSSTLIEAAVQARALNGQLLKSCAGIELDGYFDNISSSGGEGEGEGEGGGGGDGSCVPSGSSSSGWGGHGELIEELNAIATAEYAAAGQPERLHHQPQQPLQQGQGNGEEGAAWARLGGRTLEGAASATTATAAAAAAWPRDANYPQQQLRRGQGFVCEEGWGLEQGTQGGQEPIHGSFPSGSYSGCSLGVWQQQQYQEHKEQNYQERGQQHQQVLNPEVEGRSFSQQQHQHLQEQQQEEYHFRLSQQHYQQQQGQPQQQQVLSQELGSRSSGDGIGGGPMKYVAAHNVEAVTTIPPFGAASAAAADASRGCYRAPGAGSRAAASEWHGSSQAARMATANPSGAAAAGGVQAAALVASTAVGGQGALGEQQQEEGEEGEASWHSSWDEVIDQLLTGGEPGEQGMVRQGAATATTQSVGYPASAQVVSPAVAGFAGPAAIGGCRAAAATNVVVNAVPGSSAAAYGQMPTGAASGQFPSAASRSLQAQAESPGDTESLPAAAACNSASGWCELQASAAAVHGPEVYDQQYSNSLANFEVDALEAEFTRELLTAQLTVVKEERDFLARLTSTLIDQVVDLQQDTDQG